ncbi:hypothetical protein JOL62DRAFT_178105 [Phyllosticta paracitricarpa]|uniref:Uncharacterized protein n=1 Tax=Phyllosticta paracitricarpa TaxID=2016321 RepID=A0ABR1N2U6_9PEZI
MLHASIASAPGRQAGIDWAKNTFVIVITSSQGTEVRETGFLLPAWFFACVRCPGGDGMLPPCPLEFYSGLSELRIAVGIAIRGLAVSMLQRQWQSDPHPSLDMLTLRGVELEASTPPLVLTYRLALSSRSCQQRSLARKMRPLSNNLDTFCRPLSSLTLHGIETAKSYGREICRVRYTAKQQCFHLRCGLRVVADKVRRLRTGALVLAINRLSCTFLICSAVLWATASGTKLRASLHTVFAVMLFYSVGAST